MDNTHAPTQLHTRTHTAPACGELQEGVARWGGQGGVQELVGWALLGAVKVQAPGPRDVFAGQVEDARHHMVMGPVLTIGKGGA